MKIYQFLEVYDKTIDIFRDYYQYEVIEGADRKKVEKNTRGCVQRGGCKCVDPQSLGHRGQNQNFNV